jgi:hypothetical protein
MAHPRISRSLDSDRLMTEEPAGRTAAYEFVLEHVDSVPHLEALLLLWNTRPQVWPASELAGRLYVSIEGAKAILQELARQQLILCSSEEEHLYCYSTASEEQDSILRAVDETYRREMVAVSSMIHSKASRAVRDFSRAFRFTKERE